MTRIHKTGTGGVTGVHPIEDLELKEAAQMILAAEQEHQEQREAEKQEHRELREDKTQHRQEQKEDTTQLHQEQKEDTTQLHLDLQVEITEEIQDQTEMLTDTYLEELLDLGA